MDADIFGCLETLFGTPVAEDAETEVGVEEDEVEGVADFPVVSVPEPDCCFGTEVTGLFAELDFLRVGMELLDPTDADTAVGELGSLLLLFLGVGILDEDAARDCLIAEFFVGFGGIFCRQE